MDDAAAKAGLSVGQRPESPARGDDRGSAGQRQLEIAAVMGRVTQLHGQDQLAQN